MVGINSIHDMYALHSNMSGGAKVSGKKAVEEATPSRESGADRVIISRSASFRAKLEAVSKQYASAAQTQESVSPARIERLRAQYQGDACPVSGSDIAQVMLSRACGFADKTGGVEA